MALRALGRFRDRTVISPAWGAGMEDNLIGDDNEPPPAPEL